MFSLIFNHSQSLVSGRDGVSLITAADLSPSLVDVGGILIQTAEDPSQAPSTTVPSQLVDTESTQRNLQSIAMALMLRKPVLLEGVTGAGKTSLVEEIARRTHHTGPHSRLVKIQMGDQTDSKALLGTYVSTEMPGHFEYQRGVLVECVLQGRWVLIEDIDLAPMDVVSVLFPLLESGQLFVPGRGEVYTAHSGFQIFATHSLSSRTTHESRLLQHLWTVVHVEPASRSEIEQIIAAHFPTLAAGTRTVLAAYDVLCPEAPAARAKLNLSRPLSVRDLLKWCRRIVERRAEGNNTVMFKEAYDCFCAFNATAAVRWQLAEALSHVLDISPDALSHFRETDKPSQALTDTSLTVGRVSMQRGPVCVETIRADAELQANNFAYSRQVLLLLEQLGACVQLHEPVLLVGETGTGKTTAVGQLAGLLRQRLVVVNMSQQSDVSELLGGYKPVELRGIIEPALEHFETLFFRTFSRKTNAEFMNKTKLAFHKGKWPQLLKIFQNTLTRVHDRLAKADTDDGEWRIAPDVHHGWLQFEQSLTRLQVHVEHADNSFAFSFVEGSLVRALRAGHWVLLDEINLASTETLECLNGLLDGSTGSVLLTERGDMEPVERHVNFRLFACMNPATDVGKKNLPAGLRNRFTEIFVGESEVFYKLVILS